MISLSFQELESKLDALCPDWFNRLGDVSSKVGPIIGMIDNWMIVKESLNYSILPLTIDNFFSTNGFHKKDGPISDIWSKEGISVNYFSSRNLAHVTYDNTHKPIRLERSLMSLKSLSNTLEGINLRAIQGG